jgi:RND family efflux transporter MFP subunit
MTRLVAVTAFVAAATLSSGCRRADAVLTSGAESRPADFRTASRLSAPERVRFAPQVVATGNLKPQQQAQLAFSVPGTLERIAVKRGQSVAEGTVLASLDLALARAAVAQAEAGGAAAGAQLRLAEDALARMTAIRKEDGIPESQLVQAQSQRDLAAAQALAAQAQLEQARVNLSHHVLRAPFAGVVTRVPDGTGIAVSPGTTLFTLESTRTLTLETSLTQEDAVGVDVGTRVTVIVPVTGARTEEATVRAVVPAVDSTTNRVPLEVAVPNPDGRFLSHAFARVHFPSGAPREALRVPAGSLTQREGAFSIWIAGADGRARVLPVRLLDQQAETAIVAPEAFPAGARVVDTPPLGIAEGTLIAEGSAR